MKLVVICDNNTKNNIEKRGRCEQDSCVSRQTPVLIGRGCYSPGNGVLTSEGAFCEEEELALSLIEKFHGKCNWDKN